MTGQGSPSSWANAAPGRADAPRRLSALRMRGNIAHRVALVLVFFTHVWMTDRGAAQESTTPQSVRLRVTWGSSSEPPARWRGRIALRGGNYTDLKILDDDAGALASYTLDPNVVHVHAIEAQKSQSIDIAAFVGNDARLLVELTADHMPAPFTAEFPVAQISRQATAQPIDDRGHTITIHRPPSDALRVETNHTVLVFSPGETFSFTLRPMLPELEPGTTFDVSTALVSSRDGRTVWSDDQRLPVPVDNTPTAQVAIPLPFEEGVYTVRVSAAHPPGLTDRFFPVGTKHEALAERSFQIVVLKLSAELSATESAWETVLAIDPANPRWWQRLPKWTQLERLPGLAAGPLGSLRAGTVDHPLGHFVELPPTTAGNEPHWQAYPLPLEHAGSAHLVEVDYPADEEQHLGLSILEPHAVGAATSIGRDIGVYVEGFGLGEHVETHTNRVTFWPQSNSPLLLVTNIHPEASARFGAIRVLRRNGPLSGGGPRISWQNTERIVAAYFARPLVAESFGAPRSDAAAGPRRAADWQSLFEGAQRLADYLPYAGFNAAVISGLGDGSMTNARRLVASADTKSILPVGDDLPDADALELYLRVFDRSGLALVPSLGLAAPLPQLERLRQVADPHSSGLDCVGPDGRTWLETNGTRDGRAPYYNLLDERVQQAVLIAASELLKKYGHHSSLAGIAVQLSGTGYAQLPGLDWGFDDATWSAFQRETGVIVHDGGPTRFAARHAAASGEHADEWRAWRAQRVTRFYHQLGQVVSTSGPNRRLLLTTDDVFGTTELKSLMRPSIQSNVRLDQAMMNVGIDRTALMRSPGIMLTAAQFVEPAGPLVDRASHLQLNEAVANARRSEGDSPPAALFFHPPQRVSMSGFAAKSGYLGYSQLVAQSSADTSANRRPYARVLANEDPAWVIEGGEFLPLGQEDATRDVRRILQQLPANSRATVHRHQPVTIRTYAVGARTICLVVNDSPWTADVNVLFELPRTTNLQPLIKDGQGESGAAVAPQTLAAGRQRWAIELPAYGIQAVEINSSDVIVGDVQAAVSAAAKAELAARLEELDGRDLTAPSIYPVLENSGFEPLGGGAAMPGWELVANANQAKIELDATLPRVGKTCLYWRSLGGRSVLQSNSFPTPPSGQLFLSAFIRGENIGPTTELRMALESDHDGKIYRQFVLIGGSAADANPFAERWGRPPGFWVNDVPLDSRGTMRVKFELNGPGEIWIDDVKLQDLLFPLKYYPYFAQERLEFVKIKKAARSAVDDQRIADSVQLLENYWPRFLLEYTQPAPPQVVVRPPPAQPVAAPAVGESDETPAVSGFKKYLPGWFR